MPPSHGTWPKQLAKGVKEASKTDVQAPLLAPLDPVTPPEVLTQSLRVRPAEDTQFNCLYPCGISPDQIL